MTIEEQLADLARRETVITGWLGRDVSEVARGALEEDLRRLREQRRNLELRRIQTIGDCDDNRTSDRSD
jgi:hypothetical protein